MFSSLGYMLLVLRFGKKRFFSTTFLVIIVCPSNEWNFNSHNNLHSFCNWAQQSCCPYWDTQYWCFHFVRKFFFAIFLKIKVNLRNETNLDSRNNLHFLLWLGTTMMFSTLGYMTLMLWICKKSFSLHHFPYNQSSSMKWSKLGYM